MTLSRLSLLEVDRRKKDFKYLYGLPDCLSSSLLDVDVEVVVVVETDVEEDCILIHSIRFAASFTSTAGEEGGGVYRPLLYCEPRVLGFVGVLWISIVSSSSS